MSDASLLDVSDDNSLGKVVIAPEVIEVITSIAASEVHGVSAMRGNFAAGVAERFGKKAYGKGVKLDIAETGILIDLYVVLHFGTAIPKVAQELQTNVRQTLRSMTALEIGEVNVHVVGVQMEDMENTDGNTE